MLWSACDLENKLKAFQHYYKNGRVHSALNGKPPERAGIIKRIEVADLNQYRWQSYCRDLFRLPVAA